MTNIVFVLHSMKLWVSKLEQPENGCDKILRLGKKLICDQRPGTKRGDDETTRMWEVLQPLFTCTLLQMVWSPVSQTGMSHYEVAHHRRSAQPAKGCENVVIYLNALAMCARSCFITNCIVIDWQFLTDSAQCTRNEIDLKRIDE